MDERRHETNVDGQVAWAGLWHKEPGAVVCRAYTDHGQSSVTAYLDDVGNAQHLKMYVPKHLSRCMAPVVCAILIEAVHIAQTGEIPE